MHLSTLTNANILTGLLFMNTKDYHTILHPCMWNSPHVPNFNYTYITYYLVYLRNVHCESVPQSTGSL